MRTFRGAALPGGVFGPKTAVGHRAEARRHEKFASSSRAFLTEPRESVGDEHGNLESAIGRRSKPACLLTFDDGTKD
ncbi:MAG TPA: hypothetical protein VFC46_00365, partial [Humisphaera sp.]|nr:hypothetical protein [Humisphaera sp.]